MLSSYAFAGKENQDLLALAIRLRRNKLCPLRGKASRPVGFGQTDGSCIYRWLIAAAAATSTGMEIASAALMLTRKQYVCCLESVPMVLAFDLLSRQRLRVGIRSSRFKIAVVIMAVAGNGGLYPFLCPPYFKIGHNLGSIGSN